MGTVGGAVEPTTSPRAGETNLSPQQREELFQKLLAGYCKVISASRSTSPIPVRLGGWPALQVPASSIMGLVLLSEGNTRTTGPYARQLDKLYKYVALTASRKDVGASHESWTLAFATLFLSEVHRANPSADLKSRITRLVKRLESGRQGAKGWHHSLKNTGYGPFVAVTIWCTAAIASAAEQGVTVDADGLAASLRGLANSIGRSGGAFYFTHKHSSDVKPGRTGGVAWVLTRYARSDPAKLAAARSFLVRHADVAPAGHGSWMMNMGWAALGASCADAKTREAFWSVHRKTIFKTRVANGFFGVQRWTETGFRDSRDDKPVMRGDSKTWPDPMYGDAWATVWMFFVWQLERGKSVLVQKLPPPKMGKTPRTATTPAFDEDTLTARIRKGKAADVRKEIHALIKKFPRNARLYRLRALTYLPPLLEPFPMKDLRFHGAWGSTVESLALRELSAALTKKEGKGDVPDEFNANIYLLRAKIHAKRTVRTYRPNSATWVRYYKLFVKDIKAILKINPRNYEATTLLKTVNTAVNMRKRTPSSTGKRR